MGGTPPCLARPVSPRSAALVLVQCFAMGPSPQHLRGLIPRRGVSKMHALQEFPVQPAHAPISPLVSREGGLAYGFSACHTSVLQSLSRKVHCDCFGSAFPRGYGLSGERTRRHGGARFGRVMGLRGVFGTVGGNEVVGKGRVEDLHIPVLLDEVRFPGASTSFECCIACSLCVLVLLKDAWNSLAVHFLCQPFRVKDLRIYVPLDEVRFHAIRRTFGPDVQLVCQNSPVRVGQVRSHETEQTAGIAATLV